MQQTNDNTHHAHPRHRRHVILGFAGMSVSILSVINIALVILIALGLTAFERRYNEKVYPNVTVGGVPFGGKSPGEVEQYWKERNVPFRNKIFELRVDEQIATFSAVDLNLGYDATLSATQAYVVGRSSHALSNLFTKLFRKTDLTPLFRWNTDVFDVALDDIAERIDIPAEDALFSFEKNRVTAFRASHNGRRVNKEKARQFFADLLPKLSTTEQTRIIIPLPVEILSPTITTDQVNSFGIHERIGVGYSEFKGSIPGRIHNVLLAAAKINGILIKPGETFSLVNALGDISAATGYQAAYIIKDGRTVLGDGGGVCQVSSTLFRAALNAGLPIPERHAHAYRVHYYEEGGFKPGIDATVFAPNIDLKITNDTPGYILIQTKADPQNLTLAFELYGTSDGRQAQIYNHIVWGEAPPPPPLYQDDPTLKVGVVKQVDFDAWGANASFQYRVTRSGDVLQDTKFVSNFRPWQAVYLRGTAN